MATFSMALVVWNGKSDVGIWFKQWPAVEDGRVGLDDFFLEQGLDGDFDSFEDALEVFEDEFLVLYCDRSDC